MIATIETTSFVALFHVVFCAFGILIGFFGMEMLIGQYLEAKVREINGTLSERNHTKIKDELRLFVLYQTTIKELSISTENCFRSNKL